jgi:hypothetical protein
MRRKLPIELVRTMAAIAAVALAVVCPMVPLVHAADRNVPSPVAVDREENGHIWRRYFHEMPIDSFRFREPSLADWYYIWSAYEVRPGSPIAVRYECRIDEEGRYIGAPYCRARCDSGTDARSCKAGQRYFERAYDALPDMPKDHDPERAKLRYVGFSLNLDPAQAPEIDFDTGALFPFAELVRNHKQVAGLSSRIAADYVTARMDLTITCKVLSDRSVACTPRHATPSSMARRPEGIAEQFALFAKAVNAAPDGGSPIGARFETTLRFVPPEGCENMEGRVVPCA